ncbi:hypothetical protein HDU88_003978 [Geranomyces variabilis]|nr:hypothetical protein HDU88_003978 [Geranomyces variabilis]
MRLAVIVFTVLLALVASVTAAPFEQGLYRRDLGAVGRAEWQAWLSYKKALLLSSTPELRRLAQDQMLKSEILTGGERRDLDSGDFNWPAYTTKPPVTTFKAMKLEYIMVNIPGGNPVPRTFLAIVRRIFQEVADQMKPHLDDVDAWFSAAQQAHAAWKAAASVPNPNAANVEILRQQFQQAVKRKNVAVRRTKDFIGHVQEAQKNIRTALNLREDVSAEQGPDAAHTAVQDAFRDGLNKVNQAYLDHPKRPSGKQSYPKTKEIMYKSDFDEKARLYKLSELEKYPQDLEKATEPLFDYVDFPLLSGTPRVPGTNKLWTYTAAPLTVACPASRKRSVLSMLVTRDTCTAANADAAEAGLLDSLEASVEQDDLEPSVSAEDGDDGDSRNEEAAALVAIRALTKNTNILVGTPDTTDEDSGLYQVALSADGELDPRQFYKDEVDSQSAWQKVADAVEDYVGGPTVDSEKTEGALRLWRRALRNRLAKLALKPRESRTEKDVSSVQRQLETFDRAVNAFRAASASIDSPVALPDDRVEAFGDISDAFKSTQQIKSESEIEAFKQFSIAGVATLLPDGMEGIAVTVNDDGSVNDEIDLQSLFDASIAGDSYESSWLAVGSEVASFIEKITLPDAEFPMKQSQHLALKRGLHALAKSINKTPGQGGALRGAFSKIMTAFSKVDKTALKTDLDEGSPEKFNFDLTEDPFTSTSESANAVGPLPPMAATHIAGALWPAETADAVERIIGDSNAIIPSKDKHSMMRVWKPVVRGIRNQLRRDFAANKPPAAALQTAAVNMKAAYSRMFDEIRNADPPSRENDAAKVVQAVALFNDYNELSIEAILSNAASFQDANTGAILNLMNDDLPDDMQQIASALVVKNEILALTILQKVDANVLPSNGMDPNQGGANEVFNGLSQPYRALTPNEIYAGAGNVEGATPTDAWNKAIISAQAAVKDANEGSDVARKLRVSNALKKVLNHLKSVVAVRTEVQKAPGPLDRSDAGAIDLAIHTENFRTLAGSLAAASAITQQRETVDDPMRGQNLNEQDLRSGDAVMTEHLVDAFSDARDVNPSMILPNGDIAPSGADENEIDPSSLYSNAGSVNEAITNFGADLTRTIASSPPDTDPRKLATWKRALRNIKEGKISMWKIAAAGWGQQDLSQIPKIIEDLRAASNTETSASAAMKTAFPDSDKADNAAGSAGVRGNDIPDAMVDTVANQIETTNPARNPKSRNTRMRLRNVRRSQAKAANGRSPREARGTASPATRPSGPGSGENGGARGGSPRRAFSFQCPDDGLLNAVRGYVMNSRLTLTYLSCNGGGSWGSTTAPIPSGTNVIQVNQGAPAQYTSIGVQTASGQCGDSEVTALKITWSGTYSGVTSGREPAISTKSWGGTGVFGETACGPNQYISLVRASSASPYLSGVSFGCTGVFTSMTSSTIQVRFGGSIPITSSMMRYATARFSEPAYIQWKINSGDVFSYYGSFTKSGALVPAMGQWGQDDINQGRISFKSTGNSLSQQGYVDSYSGIYVPARAQVFYFLTGLPKVNDLWGGYAVTANIIIQHNMPPSVSVPALIGGGMNKPIQLTSNVVSATDVETSVDGLVWTLVSITPAGSGNLSFCRQNSTSNVTNTVTIGAGGTFLQSDIVVGAVWFTPGANVVGTPIVSLTLSDGLVGAPVAVSLYFNVTGPIWAYGISWKWPANASPLLLAPEHMALPANVSDPVTVTYKISNVTSTLLAQRLVNNMSAWQTLATNEVFSYAEVSANQIRISLAPGFVGAASLAYTALATGSSPYSTTIKIFADLPRTIFPSSIVKVGQSDAPRSLKTLINSTTDPELTRGVLTFSLLSPLPQIGVSLSTLNVNGTWTSVSLGDSFTRTDINNDGVQLLVTNASQTGTGSFSLTLSDGVNTATSQLQIMLVPAPVVVTVNPRKMSANSRLILNSTYLSASSVYASTDAMNFTVTNTPDWQNGAYMVFVPPTGSWGTTSLDVRISDGVQSVPASVGIVANAVPYFFYPTYSITITRATVSDISYHLDAYDRDHDTLRYFLASNSAMTPFGCLQRRNADRSYTCTSEWTDADSFYLRYASLTRKLGVDNITIKIADPYDIAPQPQMLTVTIVAAPVALSVARVYVSASVNASGTTILSNATLLAGAADSTAAQVGFNLAAAPPPGVTLELLQSSAWTTLWPDNVTFSQDDVNHNRVRITAFVAAEANLTVSLTAATDGSRIPVALTLATHVAPTIIANNPLSLNWYTSQAISSAMLGANSSTIASSAFIYTFVNVAPSQSSSVTTAPMPGGITADVWATYLAVVDPDGPDPLTFTLINSPIGGNLTLNGATLGPGSTWSATDFGTGLKLQDFPISQTSFSVAINFTMTDGLNPPVNGGTSINFIAPMVIPNPRIKVLCRDITPSASYWTYQCVGAPSLFAVISPLPAQQIVWVIRNLGTVSFPTPWTFNGVTMTTSGFLYTFRSNSDLGSLPFSATISDGTNPPQTRLWDMLPYSAPSCYSGHATFSAALTDGVFTSSQLRCYAGSGRAPGGYLFTLLTTPAIGSIQLNTSGGWTTLVSLSTWLDSDVAGGRLRFHADTPQTAGIASLSFYYSTAEGTAGNGYVVPNTTFTITLEDVPRIAITPVSINWRGSATTSITTKNLNVSCTICVSTGQNYYYLDSIPSYAQLTAGSVSGGSAVHLANRTGCQYASNCQTYFSQSQLAQGLILAKFSGQGVPPLSETFNFTLVTASMANSVSGQLQINYYAPLQIVNNTRAALPWNSIALLNNSLMVSSPTPPGFTVQQIVYRLQQNRTGAEVVLEVGSFSGNYTLVWTPLTTTAGQWTQADIDRGGVRLVHRPASLQSLGGNVDIPLTVSDPVSATSLILGASIRALPKILAAPRIVIPIGASRNITDLGVIAIAPGVLFFTVTQVPDPSIIQLSLNSATGDATTGVPVFVGTQFSSDQFSNVALTASATAPWGAFSWALAVTDAINNATLVATYTLWVKAPIRWVKSDPSILVRGQNISQVPAYDSFDCELMRATEDDATALGFDDKGGSYTFTLINGTSVLRMACNTGPSSFTGRNFDCGCQIAGSPGWTWLAVQYTSRGPIPMTATKLLGIYGIPQLIAPDPTVPLVIPPSNRVALTAQYVAVPPVDSTYPGYSVSVKLQPPNITPNKWPTSNVPFVTSQAPALLLQLRQLRDLVTDANGTVASTEMFVTLAPGIPFDYGYLQNGSVFLSRAANTVTYGEANVMFAVTDGLWTNTSISALVYVHGGISCSATAPPVNITGTAVGNGDLTRSLSASNLLCVQRAGDPVKPLQYSVDSMTLNIQLVRGAQPLIAGDSFSTAELASDAVFVQWTGNSTVPGVGNIDIGATDGVASANATITVVFAPYIPPPPPPPPSSSSSSSVTSSDSAATSSESPTTGSAAASAVALDPTSTSTGALASSVSVSRSQSAETFTTQIARPNTRTPTPSSNTSAGPVSATSLSTTTAAETPQTSDTPPASATDTTVSTDPAVTKSSAIPLTLLSGAVAGGVGGAAVLGAGAYMFFAKQRAAAALRQAALTGVS